MHQLNPARDSRIMQSADSRVAQGLVCPFRNNVFSELSIPQTESEVQTRLPHAVLMINVPDKHGYNLSFK
jgi:hypothetical protein